MLPLQTLAQALAGFHAEVGPILKQSSAQYGKYADLATVLAAVSPVLSKHGLVVTQTFSPFEGGCTLLRTTLLHASGESVTSDLPMPSTEGQRNALHAFGAATTYLRRYALLAILNLAAEDDDGDSFGSEQKAVAKSGRGTHKRAVVPAAPVASPNPGRLSTEAKKALLDRVQDLGSDLVPQLADAFRARFGLAAEVPVSDYIKTQAHADFSQRPMSACSLRRLQRPEAPPLGLADRGQRLLPHGRQPARQPARTRGLVRAHLRVGSQQWSELRV